METARRPSYEQHASEVRSPRPSAHDPPPVDSVVRSVRSRRERRHLALPLLTAGAVPTVIAGAEVLLTERAPLIESDVVFVAIALVTVSAAGFLIGVLGVLLFVLVDRDRTERLVRIISALTRRRRRRRDD
jgi:hypothetical protein